MFADSPQQSGHLQTPAIWTFDGVTHDKFRSVYMDRDGTTVQCADDCCCKRQEQ